MALNEEGVMIVPGIDSRWIRLPNGAKAHYSAAGSEGPAVILLHGGIVAALIDEISGRAQMGSDPMDPRFMFTAKLEVRYRRNVPIGKPLKIVGKAGRVRARSAEAWAGIYDAETDELLAEGNTLLIDVPADQFDRSGLGELGWKIYPE